ncbi:mechanosensitive ion channel domain-containing protein [Arenimonas sp.]|uniref:mechanosensitive ion channel family protein n=1 Tax=Arenimonas sp. TaxID=1872635 RepID=UPI0025BC3D65|nr:mechanosensitive ion channel domain-containing protein [Arenimonas sp.]
MVMPAATTAAPAAVERSRGWLGQELFQAGDVVVTTGGLALALAALAVAWLLSWVFRRGLAQLSRRNGARDRQAAIYTVGRIVHYLLLVIGLLVALEFIGLPASRFAVFAGAIGVGLGFGLQAIFNNFISGLILLFDRSLKVGDFVELESGVHGEVSDINIRATRITTNDNIEILVPNSEFVTGRVVNWTHREVSRRLRIPFGVAYGSDKEKVKAAALEAAAAVPFTLAQDGPRRPQVWLAGFGDSCLEFQLVVWLTAEATKRPSAVKAAYNWELESALARHGLEIPFPQRDLHLRSAFGLSGHEAWSALGRPVPEKPEAAPAPRSGGNDATEDVERQIAESPPKPDPEA